MAEAFGERRKPGRPPVQAAAAHAAVMDAVFELLQERSARDLTMEMVAKRAKVGKPTLYKWWPSKAALILAMFGERFHGSRDSTEAATAEEAIRNRIRRLIREFNGAFGKVMATLIAEGQSDPTVLHELFHRHILPSRLATLAELKQGQRAGEIAADADAALMIDAIFGPVCWRLLLQSEPLTEKYGEGLVDLVFRGARLARPA